MLNLYRGFKLCSATNNVDFFTLESVYSLFKTRLTVILIQPAISAFSLYNYNVIYSVILQNR